MKTSGMLGHFFYCKLKRGLWNHDAFCRGVLDIREAKVGCRLWDGPRFPIPKVPEKDMLAFGTFSPPADMAD